jgi:uridine phosphorylase
MKGKTPGDDNNVLIEPKRIDGEPKIGADCIIASISSDLHFIVEFSKAKKSNLKMLGPFEFFLVRQTGQLPLALAGPALGASHAVMVMEKLIALGAKRVWFLGWCGSLQPSLSTGDLIIPTFSASEEGTSQHYPVHGKRCRTNSLLNSKLETALSRSKLPFKKGPVWTTDAIYRETKEKVKSYARKGILAVEMEISALTRLAVYRSVDFAALLVVSDELSSLEWCSGFTRKDFKRKTHEVGRLIYDLCVTRQEF